MNIKTAISIIVLLLPLAGLTLSREGLTDRQKSSAIMEDGLLLKLNIEKIDKRTPALDFILKDLNGNKIKLQDLRGKVVFLNFWATWCPSCRLEMPSMEKLHEEFGNQGLVVLAINYREKAEEINAFFKEHRVTFTTLLDEQGRSLELYKAWSLPTTYLINRNGEIVGKLVGHRDWHSEQARVFFRQLLEGKG
jgi:thiol-disulfide isomerase/thioredoxin